MDLIYLLYILMSFIIRIATECGLSFLVESLHEGHTKTIETHVIHTSQCSVARDNSIKPSFMVFEETVYLLIIIISML